jgi:hypothetical protein
VVHVVAGHHAQQRYRGSVVPTLLEGGDSSLAELLCDVEPATAHGVFVEDVDPEVHGRPLGHKQLDDVRNAVLPAELVQVDLEQLGRLQRHLDDARGGCRRYVLFLFLFLFLVLLHCIIPSSFCIVVARMLRAAVLHVCQVVRRRWEAEGSS